MFNRIKNWKCRDPWELDFLLHIKPSGREGICVQEDKKLKVLQFVWDWLLYVWQSAEFSCGSQYRNVFGRYKVAMNITTHKRRWQGAGWTVILNVREKIDFLIAKGTVQGRNKTGDKRERNKEERERKEKTDWKNEFKCLYLFASPFLSVHWFCCRWFI